MAHLHDEGELLVLNRAFDGQDVEVGLYNDSTDTLDEGATYSSITTEPTGSAYATQSVADPTVSQNSGTTEVDMGSLSFDTSDSSAGIDYVYVRDPTSGDLIFTNQLDQTYDLNSIDVLDLSNVGLQLD